MKLFQVISILFGMFIYISIANANTYYIKKSSTLELRKVLNQARNGDKIILLGGIYKGNFQINKSIMMTAKTRSILTSSFNGTVLKINAPNVIIDKVMFSNSGQKLNQHNACVYLDQNANNAKILNNNFNNCLFSIWLNHVSGTYIKNNSFKGSTEKNLSNRGNAIEVWFNNSLEVLNNIFINGRDGVYSSNTQNIVIKNNHFSHVRFGIHFMYNNQSFIANNTVAYSTSGMELMYSKKAIISNNILKFNKLHGLFLRQIQFSKIISNLSTRNNTGLVLSGSTENTVQNNNIIENNIGVEVSAGSINNRVYNNNFINNRLPVQYTEVRTIQWGYNGRGNFWSEYHGFDYKHDGVGDKPYYVTNLGQWLIYSYPVLKVIFSSPSMSILQKIDNQFPVLRKAGLIDKYPLTREVNNEQ